MTSMWTLVDIGGDEGVGKGSIAELQGWQAMLSYRIQAIFDGFVPCLRQRWCRSSSKVRVSIPCCPNSVVQNMSNTASMEDPDSIAMPLKEANAQNLSIDPLRAPHYSCTPRGHLRRINGFVIQVSYQ